MSGRPQIPLPEARQLRSAGWTYQRLADRYGVTRAAVFHRLHRSVSRRNHPRPPHPCRCGCGHLTTQIYASRDCYFWHTCWHTHPSLTSRSGTRAARAVVSHHFPLQPHHVVHHVDKNQGNNDLSNLWVFASQATHLSYHRRGSGRPIWKGSDQ